ARGDGPEPRRLQDESDRTQIRSRRRGHGDRRHRADVAPDGVSGGAPRDVESPEHESHGLPEMTAASLAINSASNHMTIQSAILGEVTVNAQDVVSFPAGLLGFPECRSFAP